MSGLAFGEPVPPRPRANNHGGQLVDDDGRPFGPEEAALLAVAQQGGFTTPTIEAQRMLRSGGVLAERARAWLRAELLWRLRGSDPERVGRIARGGGPTRVGDRFHLYCPACGCRKSGDPETPNGRDGDVCDDQACPCHDDEGNDRP